jgi:hypothetical protein
MPISSKPSSSCHREYIGGCKVPEGSLRSGRSGSQALGLRKEAMMDGEEDIVRSDPPDGRRAFLKRMAVFAFAAPVISSFVLDGAASAETPDRHGKPCPPPNQYGQNQTSQEYPPPNQYGQNQTSQFYPPPNQYGQNQTQQPCPPPNQYGQNQTSQFYPPPDQYGQNPTSFDWHRGRR